MLSLLFVDWWCWNSEHWEAAIFEILTDFYKQRKQVTKDPIVFVWYNIKTGNQYFGLKCYLGTSAK